MAFAPQSTVYLCNVPFDNTYKNVVYFSAQTEQEQYFLYRVKHTLEQYVTVRKVLPDGGVQSSIKVGINIDRLYDCNYMMYLNENHSTRYHFAFITKLIYINEETTEIVFETDVYQTWRFKVEFWDSFVVREHAPSDELGENLVPEPLECNDYTYTYVGELLQLDSWGYLIALSNPADSSKEGERPQVQSGIFQGLYFYYIDDAFENHALGAFLNGLTEDSVQFVSLIPAFCLSKSSVGPTEANPNVHQFYVQETDSPAYRTFQYNFDTTVGLFEGYRPKNKKLYTNPFTNAIISKHTGEAIVYNVEEFNEHNTEYGKTEYGFMEFCIYGDISTSPSVMIYPRYYKGLPHNVDYGVTIRDFTQCSTTNDAYKLWWAKNRENIGVNVAGGLVNSAFGVGSAIAGFMTGNPLVGIGGLSGAANGVLGIAQTWGSVKAAEHMANRASLGNPSTNLLTAMGQNKFTLYKRSARKDYAEFVDNFFTMYGYQTNKVKAPNMSSRPYFNYLQTNGINITGSIPCDDMVRLKRIFDEGVTLWKSHAVIGDYSVDNSP